MNEYGLFEEKVEKKYSSKKTRSITFRLDVSVIENLQHDADEKEISLNVLVNQILRKYTSWDKYSDKLGLIPMPKILLSTIIKNCLDISKEKGIKDIEAYKKILIKQAATSTFEILKDAVLFMKNDYNLWTVLEILHEYMKSAGINSDHKIEDHDIRKHIFIIQHELGSIWSEFSEELLKMIFEKLANTRIKTKTTNSTIVAEVEL
ncbi:MAG: hypothetical protein ACPKPY_07710 [Nitrososphaeraceae archaeon]